MQHSIPEQAILTLGYGSASLEEVLELLGTYEIQYLLDVRSAPYSKFKPEFSRRPLEQALEARGFRYVFFGDTLGGRPSDPSCLQNGKVDYSLLRQSSLFRAGLERVRTAWENGNRVCLFCSEGRPEDCHRSKLLGVALSEEGIPVHHILHSGQTVSQSQVIHSITGGQGELFGTHFTSRKSYTPIPDDIS